MARALACAGAFRGNPNHHQDFDNDAFPPEVVGPLIATEGDRARPSFHGLTRRVISAGSAVFPSILPTGYDWAAELDRSPASTRGQGSGGGGLQDGREHPDLDEAWTDSTLDLAGSSVTLSAPAWAADR